MFKVPEEYRIRTGIMGSDVSYGNNGAFTIPFKTRSKSLAVKKNKTVLRVICSDGMYWEHVSVSMPTRTPSWQNMCFIKDMFWDEDDIIVQFHPAKSDYVDNHKHCLHMWRPVDQPIPMPPSIMVGFV